VKCGGNGGVSGKLAGELNRCIADVYTRDDGTMSREAERVLSSVALEMHERFATDVTEQLYLVRV